MVVLSLWSIWVIEALVPSNELVAQKIHRVFQRSYQVEAQLIGVSDFPPLQRSIEDFTHSTTLFFGFIENKGLAAVIEVSFANKHLAIESLVVDPDHFRKGIAGKLLTFILKHDNYHTASVETAVVNVPAITLYQKYGFVVQECFTPSHGIEKVSMALARP
ncbi:N-acetyltransferase [Thalassotalea sp. 1_MG-2023]|uniref:GNAT family N-acetyltransferase n=1 Tax=Thalassotalea sp. 1_MG-2023 TaxID=3062680 RepID=UPI0026E391ED|nr:N-acetyltransferase [Thalassotalea sp. 1_MG-2023]MDO6427933.1 N-acetyltransferase [Thalassotalea sp. 1_MG-2023]